jgi:putative intracellular protease/amidase
MAAPRKVLMLGGDYMEDYEAAVPLYALAAAPGKRPGDSCLTTVHDFLGFEVRHVTYVLLLTSSHPTPSIHPSILTHARRPQLYTELTGHRFAVTADFAAAADPSCYDALVIPGGRFTCRVELINWMSFIDHVWLTFIVYKCLWPRDHTHTLYRWKNAKLG